MSDQQKKYFNKKQIEAMIISAKEEYIIASRGFGKSEGIDAPRLVRNVFAMPRSNGVLLSPTYGKLLRNTLPAIFHALSRLGYVRDRHYVVGHRPPKKLKFKRPYIEPLNYDYTISWFNGSIQNLISFDRPMSANSMSVDYVFGYEAKFLDYDKIKNEVMPANRGNRCYFDSCPWHHGVLFTTDMPTSQKGMWILDKQKEMDPELIKMIVNTYDRIKTLEASGKKHERQLASLRKDLALFRRNALFYAEYDAFDNLEVLGMDFIKQMKRDLPPLIFSTAIMNQKMKKIVNGFYSAFSESIHVYEAVDNSYLELLDYHQPEEWRRWQKDTDYDPSIPLLIAFDYNASINSLVVGQDQDRTIKTINSMFVKTPRKLNDLVNAFCDYYHDTPNRDVVYYYDSTAIADTPLDSVSFADTVMTTLSSRGFNVIDVYIGQQARHNVKHNWIDLALKGDTRFLFPMFNEDNNEYLLLALQRTGIKQGKNGFEKNKDVEKTPDTADNPDELKTHITDAWDTLFIGANYFPQSNSMSSIPSSYHPE